MSNQLNITTRNDREIVLTRTFDAPRIGLGSDVQT